MNTENWLRTHGVSLGPSQGPLPLQLTPPELAPSLGQPAFPRPLFFLPHSSNGHCVLSLPVTDAYIPENIKGLNYRTCVL